MKRILWAMAAIVATLPTLAFAADQQVYPARPMVPQVNMPNETKVNSTTGASTATATANPKIDVHVYVNGAGCGASPCPVAARQAYPPPNRQVRRPPIRSGVRICTWEESMRSTPYPHGKRVEPKWNPRRNCCDWWVIRG